MLLPAFAVVRLAWLLKPLPTGEAGALAKVSGDGRVGRVSALPAYLRQRPKLLDAVPVGLSASVPRVAGHVAVLGPAVGNAANVEEAV